MPSHASNSAAIQQYHQPAPLEQPAPDRVGRGDRHNLAGDHPLASGIAHAAPAGAVRGHFRHHFTYRAATTPFFWDQ